MDDYQLSMYPEPKLRICSGDVIQPQLRKFRSGYETIVCRWVAVMFTNTMHTEYQGIIISIAPQSRARNHALENRLVMNLIAVIFVGMEDETIRRVNSLLLRMKYESLGTEPRYSYQTPDRV